MSEDVLAILTKISGDVGTVSGKIDGITSAIDRHVAQDMQVQTALFNRLNALEIAHASAIAKVTIFKSVGTVIGAVIGMAGTFLARLVPWHHSS